MSISEKEINDFNSQINISKNILLRTTQSLRNDSKNNDSIRIFYLINENDEIINNEIDNIDKDTFFSFLFYEIFIIKLDFLKNKCKMIMIYNNEKKEYKIKIWTSKLEKAEIKEEYNKIIKKICEKKTGNNILKNIIKLKPDKYTIYYFPLNVNLFEKELVFLYIIFMTQNEKSKFPNFKQINDLIVFSKRFIIPKINDILFKKTNNKNVKIFNKNKSKTKNNNFNIFDNDNNNKENISVINIQRNETKNNISQKNQEIEINFNIDRLKKFTIKRDIKNKINFMRKPYNKIVFNYSFEKNDNENNSKIKGYKTSFIDYRKPISTIVIDSKNKTDKSSKFIQFPFNKFEKLKKENINNSSYNLPFSIPHKRNSNNIINNSINSFPYEKKRPSSIPKNILDYLSTNIFDIKGKKYYNKNNNENDVDSIYNNYSNFDNKNFKSKYEEGKVIYKRKSFSKKRNQESIDKNTNYFFTKINSKNSFENTLSFEDRETISSRRNNSIIVNKNNKNLVHNGSTSSLNPLTKTYTFIKDNKNKNNISKIPINKKATLNNNFKNIINKNIKNDFYLEINDGNKTTRHINKIISKQIIYRQKNCNKYKLNMTGDNNFQRINNTEEEISLFI